MSTPDPGTWFPCPLGCSGAVALEWEPGDADVGLGAALIGVEGDCVHVGAINMCIAEMDAVAFEESEWGKKLMAAYRAHENAWWKEYEQQLNKENQSYDPGEDAERDALLDAQERLDRP